MNDYHKRCFVLNGRRACGCSVYCTFVQLLIPPTLFPTPSMTETANQDVAGQQHPEVDVLAHNGYQRYGASTNFKNFQGNPMPTFADLPVTIQKAWFSGVNLSIGDINSLLKHFKTSAERQQVSDGYHTFAELYDHRIANYLAVCRLLAHWPAKHGRYAVWKSRLHADGSSFEGWFVLGIGTKPGEQITYHLPDSAWDGDYGAWFAEARERAPEWDGHTSADVLARLASL